MKTLARRVAMFSFASFLAVTVACSQASSGESRAPKAAAAKTDAAAGNATGAVTHKGVTMPATHSMGVWDERLSTLTVYLLPAAPGPEETAGLQEGNWRVLLGKPGPDAKKWPKAIPYSAIYLRWPEKETVGQLDKARVDVQVFGIAGADEHVMLSWMEGEGKRVLPTFTGDVKTGPVTLVSSAKQDEAAWDVKATTTVVPAR
jgi:hypothetical protein